jgi:hypothetical protein
MMAFSASVAEAETGARWLILDESGALLSNIEASINLEADTTEVLHAEIAKTKVLFECTAISAENAVLKPNGSIGNGAKIKFSGCITKLNGVTSPACVPKAGGTETGVIYTQPLHGLIVSDNLLRILPDSGETFVIKELGAECSIGSKVPVIGKLFFKDCENLSLTHLVKHLLEVDTSTALWVISKTAEHLTTILGSGWAFLSGAHQGLKFSVDPA